MSLFAMSVPIPPGKFDAWQAFASQLKGARRAEFEASRKALGVHERTFLQRMPQGDSVIVTLEGADPAGAFAKFAKGTDPFTKWFVGQVKEIHGLDLTVPPPSMPELTIDSQETPVAAAAKK